MSAEVLLGLGLALISTVVLDVGYLLQQRSASALPPVRFSHPVAALRGFLSARQWIIGVALTAAGFGIYTAALVFADISLVQAVSASGIALLALIAVRFFGQTLTRLEWIGVGLAALGLLFVGLSLIGFSEGEEKANDVAVAIWLGASVVVALALLAPPITSRGWGGVAAGLGAGLLFGAGDVATKGLMVSLPNGFGAAALLSNLFLYALLVMYALGFVVQQLAFQRGEAVAAIGVMVAATNVSPIVAGLVVFGDPLPDHPVGVVLRIGGFVLALAGSVLLARVSEGGGAEPEPGSPPTPVPA